MGMADGGHTCTAMMNFREEYHPHESICLGMKQGSDFFAGLVFFPGGFDRGINQYY
jgi:hypothetical protein